MNNCFIFFSVIWMFSAVVFVLFSPPMLSKLKLKRSSLAFQIQSQIENRGDLKRLFSLETDHSTLLTHIIDYQSTKRNG